MPTWCARAVPLNLFRLRSAITNRIIQAKDHAAVQFNIGHVDAHGRYNRDYTPIAV